MNNIEITDISSSCRSYEPLESPIVETSTQAAGHVGDEQVYRRSATGDGKIKLLRYNAIPMIKLGFDIQPSREAKVTGAGKANEDTPDPEDMEFLNANPLDVNNGE